MPLVIDEPSINTEEVIRPRQIYRVEGQVLVCGLYWKIYQGFFNEGDRKPSTIRASARIATIAQRDQHRRVDIREVEHIRIEKIEKLAG